MLYFAQNQFLGNQLWPFATIICFAMRHGLTVACPNFTRHSEHFPYFASDRYCRFPDDAPLSKYAWALATENRTLLRLGKLTGAVRTLMCPLDGEVQLDSAEVELEAVRNARRGILYLHGLYFTAHSAFVEHREEIRRLFRIQEHLWLGVRDTVAECRRRGDIVVGFHVRRGDYIGYKDDMLFGIDDYQQLADRVIALFHPKKLVFLLCATDDIATDSFPTLEMVRAPGHYVQDMYCLANSDVILGPPSTYSQWASFYSNVPIFNINSINERKHGLPETVPTADGFHVQLSGCSRRSVRRPVNLRELGLI